MQDDNLLPWEQREDESNQAFEAFDRYRQLGTGRTIERLATELQKSGTLLYGWHKQHQWKFRALAWDRHVARVTNDEILLGTAEMRKRIVLQAQNMQHRAGSRILKMSEAEIQLMSVKNVVALFAVATNAEMRARAIPENEIAAAERDDTPTFNIRFIEERPEGTVGVRLEDGTLGYISITHLERFQADYPTATINH